MFPHLSRVILWLMTYELLYLLILTCDALWQVMNNYVYSPYNRNTFYCHRLWTIFTINISISTRSWSKFKISVFSLCISMFPSSITIRLYSLSGVLGTMASQSLLQHFFSFWETENSCQIVGWLLWGGFWWQESQSQELHCKYAFSSTGHNKYGSRFRWQ